MPTQERTKRKDLEAIATILGFTIGYGNQNGVNCWQVTAFGSIVFTGTKKECLCFLQGANYAKSKFKETVE